MDLKRYHVLVQSTVAGIMNRNVITISHNQSCKDALEIFVNQRVASLPVVDETWIADGHYLGDGSHVPLKRQPGM